MVATRTVQLTGGSYHAELKSTVSLKDMVERDADRTDYEVDLILHDNPNLSPTALAPLVAQRAGVEINELEVLSSKIRLTVNQSKLDDLATLDSVNRIEEVRPKTWYNDQARTVLQADALVTSTGYQGAGQVVCVADTGFDQGTATDTADAKVHPAFAGRVDRLVSLWVAGDARDPVGHGTHVCGSICGSGTYSDSVQGMVSVKGTAPAAKLMVQSMSKLLVGRWILKAPGEMSALFGVPYSLGVRIHNNSWGDKWDPKTGQLGYERDASEIDEFIYEHQDFIVLIAAGNDAREPNHGTSQVGDNGAAKNCITVGATGSTRPNDGQRYYPEVPALSGITDTAIFSSRGPTKSTVDSTGSVILGRIKPDVVAPGVAILSAASRAVGERDPVRTRNGVSEDKDWLFMSGSSMATPLVAGCIALIREALQKRGKQQPSAALVKALLINGAVSRSSPAGPGFDYEQGFGRVDVNSSIAMIKQSAHCGFVDGGNKLETGPYDVPALRLTSAADRSWQSPAIPVPSGRNKLVATLTYPDKSGALLQNDVNLVVRAGDVERHGNMGSDTGFDHTSKSLFLCLKGSLFLEMST